MSFRSAFRRGRVQREEGTLGHESTGERREEEEHKCGRKRDWGQSMGRAERATLGVREGTLEEGKC